MSKREFSLRIYLPYFVSTNVKNFSIKLRFRFSTIERSFNFSTAGGAARRGLCGCGMGGGEGGHNIRPFPFTSRMSTFSPSHFCGTSKKNAPHIQVETAFVQRITARPNERTRARRVEHFLWPTGNLCYLFFLITRFVRELFRRCCLPLPPSPHCRCHRNHEHHKHHHRCLKH